MELKSGDNVVFLGCSREQKNWGSCDDPYFLIVGHIYIVENVEVHTWHTKIKLKNIPGKFNSVCFRLVD